MKSFHDYLGLSNSCSYDVIGRADRFGFQNFCSPGHNYTTSGTPQASFKKIRLGGDAITRLLQCQIKGN